MVAKKIDLNSGEIVFDFAGAGNLAGPDAQHMHSANFRLVDIDHFTASWRSCFRSDKDSPVKSRPPSQSRSKRKIEAG